MKVSFFQPLTAALCAVLLAIPMYLPARSAHRSSQFLLNDTPFSGDAYIKDGVSYLSLADFARSVTECNVFWDGTAAHITANDLTLRAQPGQLWIEANGRFFYVPSGVHLTRGRTMLPARTLAQVFTLDLTWDAATSTVQLTGTPDAPEHGDTYYDPDTLYWLSRIISAESRGEPLAGQIAVGNVVLNRMASHRFPDTLYDVIFQDGQFEPVENGTVFDDPYHLSVTAAKLCLEGASVVGDCLFFFAPALSPGTWIVENCTYFTTIGCHRFYY